MNARYVISTFFLAMACAAQQNGNTPGSILKISSLEADRRLTSRVVPEYPQFGIDNKIQNNEVLSIVVDEKGAVEEARVYSGHPAFASASLDAVKHWTYRPFLVDGSPVRFSTKVLVLFRIAGQGRGPVPFPEHLVVGAFVAAELPPSPPQDRCKIVVDRSITEVRQINHPFPQYPKAALLAHIQGEVLLDVIIDKRGSVASVHVFHGHPLFARVAIDAVKQWTYEPYVRNGKPIMVETTVNVLFHE